MRILAPALLLAGLVPALAHEDGLRLASKNPVTGEGCCGAGACRVMRGVAHVTHPFPGWHLPWGDVVPDGESLPDDGDAFVYCEHLGRRTCFFYPRDFSW